MQHQRQDSRKLGPHEIYEETPNSISIDTVDLPPTVRALNVQVQTPRETSSVDDGPIPVSQDMMKSKSHHPKDQKLSGMFKDNEDSKMQHLRTVKVDHAPVSKQSPVIKHEQPVQLIEEPHQTQELGRPISKYEDLSSDDNDYDLDDREYPGLKCQDIIRKRKKRDTPHWLKEDVKLKQTPLGAFHDIEYLNVIDEEGRRHYPNAQEYLESTSYNIPLQDIYQIVDIFAESQASSYCAILLKVRDRELINLHLPARPTPNADESEAHVKREVFFLKVYDKSGNCLYKRVLLRLPVMWAMYQNVLIYTECMRENMVTKVDFFRDREPQLTSFKLDLKFTWEEVKHIGYFNNHIIVVNPQKSNQCELFWYRCPEKSHQHRVLAKSFSGMEIPKPTMQKVAQSQGHRRRFTIKNVEKESQEFNLPFQDFIDCGYTEGDEIVENLVLVIGDNPKDLKFLRFDQNCEPNFLEADNQHLQPFEDMQSNDREFMKISNKHKTTVEGLKGFKRINKVISKMFIDTDEKKLNHVSAVLRYPTPEEIREKEKQMDEDQVYSPHSCYKQAGKVDFYYNFRYLCTSTEYYEDIDVSFDRISLVRHATPIEIHLNMEELYDRSVASTPRTKGFKIPAGRTNRTFTTNTNISSKVDLTEQGKAKAMMQQETYRNALKQSTFVINDIALNWKEIICEGVATCRLISKDRETIQNEWLQNMHYAVKSFVNLYKTCFLIKSLFFVAHDQYLSVFFLNKHLMQVEDARDTKFRQTTQTGSTPKVPRWAHLDFGEEIDEITVNNSALPMEQNADEKKVFVLLYSGAVKIFRFNIDEIDSIQDFYKQVNLREEQMYRVTHPATEIVTCQTVMTPLLNSASFILGKVEPRKSMFQSILKWFSFDSYEDSHFLRKKKLMQQGKLDLVFLKPDIGSENVTTVATKLKVQGFEHFDGHTKLVMVDKQSSSPIVELWLAYQKQTVAVEVQIDRKRLTINQDVKSKVLQPVLGDPSLTDEDLVAFKAALQNIKRITHLEENHCANHKAIVAHGDIWLVDQDDDLLQLVARTHDMNIRTACSADQDHLYIISDGFYEEKHKIDKVDKRQLNPAGLYCVVLIKTENKFQFNSTLIHNNLAGANSLLRSDKVRFAFLHNYNSLKMIPVSHSNLISFLGMPDKEDIVINREELGTFSLLTMYGNVFSWSVATAMQIRPVTKYKLTTDYEFVDAQTNSDQSILQDYAPTTDPPQHFDNYSVQLVRRKKEADERLKKYLLLKIYNMKSPIVEVDAAFSFKILAQNKVPTFVNGESSKVEFDQPRNEIKFSKSLDKLLHIQNYGRCIIYSREQKEGSAKVVKWVEMHRLLQFQEQLLVSKQNHLFSPELNYYLGFCVLSKKFKIYRTDQKYSSESIEEDLEWEIPKSFYQKVLNKQGINALSLRKISSRIMFMDEKRIRVLSKLGTDCVFKFRCDDDPEFSGQIESYCMVDRSYAQQPCKHYYLEKEIENKKNIPERLLFCSNEYRMENALINSQFFHSDKDQSFERHVNIQMSIALAKSIKKGKMIVQRGDSGVANMLFNQSIQTIELTTEDEELVQAQNKSQKLAKMKAKIKRQNSVLTSAADIDRYVNLQKSKFDQQKKLILSHRVRSKMFKVSEAWSTTKKSTGFFAEHSFTLLDWLKIEKVLKQENFNLKKKMGDLQMIRLGLCILPGQSTIWHHIARRETSTNYELVKQLLDASHEELVEFKKQRVYYPIIQDEQSKTSMDIALQDEFYDKKCVETFFDYLKDYPTFAYSDAIVNSVLKIIKNNHSGLNDFLHSRLRKSTEYSLDLWSKNRMKKSKRNHLKHGFDMVVTSVMPYQKHQALRHELFEDAYDRQTGKKAAGRAKDLSTRIFDIPLIHLMDQEKSLELFDILADCTNVEVFSTLPIQIIIDNRWHDIQTPIMVMYTAPYFAFMFMFQLMTFLRKRSVDAWEKDFDDGILEVFDLYSKGNVLYVLSFYLLLILSVLKLIGLAITLRKTSSADFWIWKIIQTAPALLFIVFVIQESTRPTSQNNQDLRNGELSFIALASWFEFAYIMRMWEFSGYLIRMVWLCLYDIRVFAFILISVLMGFSNAQYLVGRQVNLPYAQLYMMKEDRDDMTFSSHKSLYDSDEIPTPIFSSQLNSLIVAYRNALGDWDTDSFNQEGQATTLLWFYWLSTTIICMIIMFNLLIAIVSKTFEDVMDNKTANGFMERARLISHFQGAFKLREKCVKNRDKGKKRFMLVVYESALNFAED